MPRSVRSPIFRYNPGLFWNAPETDAKAKIQPGPNNPAGVVWIGLSNTVYGISHGRSEYSMVGHAESHGYDRLTNGTQRSSRKAFRDHREFLGTTVIRTSLIFVTGDLWQHWCVFPPQRIRKPMTTTNN